MASEENSADTASRARAHDLTRKVRMALLFIPECQGRRMLVEALEGRLAGLDAWADRQRMLHEQPRSQ